ncbi:hypothetical protein [Polaribacter sp. Z022]|uniref:hypothetical protein n=1 Tax=Polaribacter sp. Z022 TaxID=2927125 RepID=UPI0020210BCA|nr:hypothetical protein [Polaribacter sp. Z022]MCL7755125.1 hypothetical protein [Polaribacter sp. Z022]
MPEIFRFTQLRKPTGINIEEVRQKHIQFFKHLTDVEKMNINQAFLQNYESGIEAVNKHIIENEGFHIRSQIPNAIIRGEYNDFNKTYFELSFLLSQYNSDKKENKNNELFAQIVKTVEEIDKNNLKEFLTLFNVHFEDLLVLYFKSSEYPSYLRILISLRRWHFVLSSFTLSKIKKSFEVVPKSKEDIEGNTVLHYLLNSKVLLPKYLFKKSEKVKPKDPKDEPIPLPDPVKKKAIKKKTKPTPLKK